jgi:hypothetical protein
MRIKLLPRKIKKFISAVKELQFKAFQRKGWENRRLKKLGSAYDRLAQKRIRRNDIRLSKEYADRRFKRKKFMEAHPSGGAEYIKRMTPKGIDPSKLYLGDPAEVDKWIQWVKKEGKLEWVKKMLASKGLSLKDLRRTGRLPLQ